MSKKISGFNVERAADNTARSTVFDRIIKEIEPVEIPAKYVQRLQVHYKDGTTLEIQGDSINQPLPISKDTARALVDDGVRQVQDIRVFLKIDAIETDVNNMVSELLNRYC